MHLRIEVGKWWLQVGKTEPSHDEQPSQPPYIDTLNTPQTVHHPERVGFYRVPNDTDHLDPLSAPSTTAHTVTGPEA